MATSSSFAQIWSGVHVEYDKDDKYAAVHQSAATAEPRGQLKHKTSPEPRYYQIQIVWRNVLAFLILHIMAIYGLYLMIAGYVQLKTVVSGKYYNIVHIIR